jgi:hypothetical protein
MLNGNLSNQLADTFARRLETDAALTFDAAHKVRRAYSLALGRPPTEKELSVAEQFLKEEPLREFTLALFNLNEFLYVN